MLHRPVALAVLALAVAAVPGYAAVSFDSQLRDVSTFAIVSYPAGESLFCTDERTSHEVGVFAETIDCYVDDSESYASALAGQLSYIFPQLYIAEGSFDAHAEISGEANFAEGLGVSRFLSEFSVDTMTDIHLTALLHASGNGATNIVFRVKDGEIFIVETIRDATVEIDEWITLEPGSYELDFVTSGYGQALPDGSGLPASGSYSGSIEFPAASVASPDGSIGDLRAAPIAVPNPLRGPAKLFPASDGTLVDGEILILDPSGRLIRRFVGVGPTGVTWDARDGDGRPVAAGIYLVRSGSGRTGRAVVLR
jgi:hypothetical protein